MERISLLSTPALIPLQNRILQQAGKGSVAASNGATPSRADTGRMEPRRTDSVSVLRPPFRRRRPPALNPDLESRQARP